MEGEFLPSNLPADDSQHFNVGGCELLCLVSVGISAEQIELQTKVIRRYAKIS